MLIKTILLLSLGIKSLTVAGKLPEFMSILGVPSFSLDQHMKL